MPADTMQQAYCVSDWLSGIGGKHRLWTNANAAILAEKRGFYCARMVMWPKAEQARWSRPLVFTVAYHIFYILFLEDRGKASPCHPWRR